MIQENETVRQAQKTLKEMEHDSPEDYKHKGEREELEAKIIAIGEFWSELDQIGTKIEEGQEKMGAIIQMKENTEKRVEQAIESASQRLEKKLERAKNWRDERKKELEKKFKEGNKWFKKGNF